MDCFEVSDRDEDRVWRRTRCLLVLDDSDLLTSGARQVFAEARLKRRGAWDALSGDTFRGTSAGTEWAQGRRMQNSPLLTAHERSCKSAVGWGKVEPLRQSEREDGSGLGAQESVRGDR